MNNRLMGKVALVTGGYSGIGGASVKLFAQEGATVVFVGRSQDKGAAYEKELLGMNLSVKFLQCDVSQKSELIYVKDYIENNYGKLDILFNNAGILRTGNIEEITEEGYVVFEQKNKFCVGDTIEIMKMNGENLLVTVEEMVDPYGNLVEACPHPGEKIRMKVNGEVLPGEIMRMPGGEDA